MTNIQQGETRVFRPKIGLSDDILKIKDGLVPIYHHSFKEDDEVEFDDPQDGYQTVKLNSVKSLDSEMRESLTNRSRTDEYIDCISRTVLSHEYNNNNNLKALLTYDRIATTSEKEKAYCGNSKHYIEVAMASQNCLQHCEKKSTFKLSWVEVRLADKTRVRFVHAYNLVNENGKYYIIDFSLPKANSEKGIFDCVVGEISLEAYNDMTNPYGGMYGVRINHPEVLSIPEYEIIYDVDKPIILDVVEEKQKKV